MQASLLWSAHEWAEANFGGVQLGDERGRRRAVAIAEAIAQQPQASLARQMQEAGALEAAYRFLQSPHGSYEQVLSPHLHQTREAAGQQSQVLLIQDTTDLDYQAHPTTTGLGPIGTGSHQGFLLQTVLPGLPERREVLRTAQQETLFRPAAPTGEHSRPRRGLPSGHHGWGTQIPA